MSPSGTQIRLDDSSHRSSSPRPSQEDNRQLLPGSAYSTSSRRGSSNSSSHASNAGLRPDDSDNDVPAESRDDSESDDDVPLPTKEKKKWQWKHLVMDSGADEPYQLQDDGATLTRLVFLRLVAITIIIGSAWLPLNRAEALTVNTQGHRPWCARAELRYRIPYGPERNRSRPRRAAGHHRSG